MSARLYVMIAALGSIAAQAPERYVVAIGPIREHQRMPCTFAIGYTADAPRLVFHPQNVHCLRMRELAGRRVAVRITPER